MELAEGLEAADVPGVDGEEIARLVANVVLWRTRDHPMQRVPRWERSSGGGTEGEQAGRHGVDGREPGPGPRHPRAAPAAVPHCGRKLVDHAAVVRVRVAAKVLVIDGARHNIDVVGKEPAKVAEGLRRETSRSFMIQ